MTMRERTTAVGLFDDTDRARDAINALKDAGFRADDIGLLMQDRGAARELAHETGTHAGEGAATGLVAGGILGGLGGWLVGIGALAIPGVGPFIAAGALGAALTGAAVGAGVGAIAGALIGMGIPEEEAKYYEQEVRGGRTLVSVQAGSRVGEADEILHDHGAYDVQHPDRMPAGRSAATAASSTMAGSTATGYEGTWDSVSPYYQQQWQARHGSIGGRWDQYEPAYRYAWETHNRPEFRDRAWTTAESDLQQGWAARHPETPWDRVRDMVRGVWEQDTAGPGTTMTGEQTVRLREEELRPRKETVKTGEVGVRKEVVSERQEMEVPVEREEVVIDRRPVERQPADRPIEESETIRVPVREERVTVEKEPVVTGEVTVGKRQVPDTQTVSGTVRREEARVEREGDVDVRGRDEESTR